MNRFLLGVVIAVAVTLVVFAAISVDSLPALIGGVIALGVIGIVLARIGVNLFSKYTDAILKHKALQYQHDEAVLKMGVIPPGSGYQPISAPAAPEPKQIAAPHRAPQRGIQFDAPDIKQNAANLLLFSMNLLGENSNRIASNPECAQANIIGYNGRKWDAMIHNYLEPTFGVVTVPGPVNNGGGAYVPESIGTVGNLYHKIRTNEAVEALPESRRA